MNAQATIAEQRELTKAARAATGAMVGIAVKQGFFAVTITRKENRKFTTEHLTPWQSHAECMGYLRSQYGNTQ